MKLGIGSYTYTWAIGVAGYSCELERLSAVGLIRKAAELGVRLVQICDNLPLHELSIDELKQIKAVSESHGIDIEIGTRGVEPCHLRKYIDIAEFLHSSLLRTIIHKAEGIIDTQEAEGYIREILPELEAKKITLAIENHERHKVKDLAKLVTNLNSKNVGICLDTVNSFGALEGPEEVIRTLMPHIVNLHFKDFTIERLSHQMGFEIKGCPAGAGRLDTQLLLTAMKELEKDPNVILELWTPYAGDYKTTISTENRWAEESIKYLREWVK